MNLTVAFMRAVRSLMPPDVTDGVVTVTRAVYRTEGTVLALSCSHHGVGQVLREVWDGTHWRPIVEGGAS